MLQSVLFNKSIWKLTDAINYLRNHNLKYIKVDETANFYRFRQKPVNKQKKYFTRKLQNGIELVIMY